MQENPESQEKKETKGNFFEAPGELRTGYTEESWAKPEEKTGEKEVRTETGEEKIEEKEVRTETEEEKIEEKEVRAETGEEKREESRRRKKHHLHNEAAAHQEQDRPQALWSLWRVRRIL